jgi:hypothetical protein
VRVVWTDMRQWSDIAIGNGFLQLIRHELNEIEQIQLSLQGEVISQARAPLADTLQGYARAVGEVQYVVAGLTSSAYELGRIEPDSWRVLQKAGGNLAGPVETADGARFIALEGRLSGFDADVLVPRGDATQVVDNADFVVGLRRLGTRSYASTMRGIRALTAAGLGDSLFDLSQLLPPDTSALQAAQRSACNLEWQHYRSELSTTGIMTAVPSAGAGGNSPAAGSAGAVAAPPVAAPAPTTGAMPMGVPPASCGGCSVLPGTQPCVFTPALGLLLWAWRRARRRP